MPPTRVAENITRGLLAGSVSEWNAAKTFKILEVTQHHYVTSLGVLPLVIALNLDAYKALSPKAKAALAKSGDLMAKLQGAASDIATKEMIASIKADPKQTLVYPSEADLKTMDTLFKPINDGIR